MKLVKQPQPLVAFAWASGLIEFGYTFPNGSLPIAISYNEDALRDAIDVYARHSRTSAALLVPGIPEAPNQNEGRKALVRFCGLITEAMEKNNESASKTTK